MALQPKRKAAGRLISRLSASPSGGGVESAVESAPNFESSERIETAREHLQRLAAADEGDQEIIRRLVSDAEEALLRLENEGPNADLEEKHVLGLEAVIEVDGSRPVLFVEDGGIDLEAAALQGSRAERWLAAASGFRTEIRNVASAVGAVQLPQLGDRLVGTAFAIAPDHIVTNRHVLEEIATFDGSGWTWKFNAEVDFAREHERDTKRRLPIVEVVLTGPNPINRTINFDNLDLAVLRVGDGDAEFPKPLSFAEDAERTHVGAGDPPAIYVMGFPAKPWIAAGSPDDGPPGGGHEYQQVLERLFANRFGSKRWAPGLVEAGAGQLAKDKKGWVMSHDSSTLGGNSGSCVVDFSDTGERVLGLHFGGQPRVENWAHVLAAVKDELDHKIPKIIWK